MATEKFHSHVDAHLRALQRTVNAGINALRQLQGLQGTPKEDLTPAAQARRLAVIKDAASAMLGIADYKGKPDPVVEKPTPEA